MKVLLSALHFANFRIFESVVRGLAERGHHVTLVADEPETFGGQALVEHLAATYPTVTWRWAPLPTDEPWFPVAQKIRFALDYVRFLHPRYVDAPKLRLRNIGRAPRVVRWLTSGPGEVLGAHRLVRAVLQSLERRMPVSERMKVFLHAESPDVAVLASLTVSRSSGMDQLKAARALGIPAAAAVQSWDHLSSKGPLHIAPDLTIVWNDLQKHEAIDMHGLPADAIAVTGAQCYDQWFGRQPTRSRADFCRRVGLDPARPFLLYVCSAMSPVPDPVEPHFVKEWITALRASEDSVLRDTGVLVRPHPERFREWDGVSLEGFGNVSVHGGTPIDGDAKADYFDALYHSAAVVGLCTSAFLEAAIVGRPVLTVLLPAYRIHQGGMAHFRYLMTVEGGLLRAAADLPAHVRQLADAVRAPGGTDERARRFLAAFVRPFGLDIAATPRFVSALEALARNGRKPADRLFANPSLATRVVGRLSVAGTHGVGHWLLMDAFDIEKAERDKTTDVTKQRRLAERTARREAEQLVREEALRRTSEERRRKAEAHLARQRARIDERLALQRLDEQREAQKRRAHRWRQWRYRLGTARPIAGLKRGLRRVSEVLGQ